MRVPGERFGLTYGAQPGGVGKETVRSVSLSGATGAPVTPMFSRYVARGTGTSVLVVVVVVADVDQID
jgi:hypothetical protein